MQGSGRPAAARRFLTGSVFAALFCVATTAPAAQESPADPPDDLPANPLQRDGRGRDGAAPDRRKAPAPMEVPDFVKPGARLIYTHTSSIGPERPGDPVTADGGTAQHDIVAVLPDRILAKVTGFAKDEQRAEFFAMTFGGAVVTADQTNVGGGAIWVLPKTLAGLRPAAGMDVAKGDWPMHGKTYKAVTVTFRGPNSVSMRAYDRGTGLLLSEAAGDGDLRPGGQPDGGLNRRFQRNTRFETYRVLELPWLKGNAKGNPEQPEWAGRVKRLVYEGGQRLLDNPGLVVPMRSEVTFTDRGDGWAAASVVTTAGDQPPGEAMKHVQGPASLDGYWMSPEVLRDLEPGVIDTDPFVGTEVRYAVQDGRLGRMGVFTHNSAKRTQTRVFAYDLEDGALRYASMTHRGLNMMLELQLTGRE